MKESILHLPQVRRTISVPHYCLIIAASSPHLAFGAVRKEWTAPVPNALTSTPYIVQIFRQIFHLAIATIITDEKAYNNKPFWNVTVCKTAPCLPAPFNSIGAQSWSFRQQNPFLRAQPRHASATSAQLNTKTGQQSLRAVVHKDRKVGLIGAILKSDS